MVKKKVIIKKGKITAINALAISLIVYLTTVLDTPANILHEINSILYTFLWDGKRPKIAAKVMENFIKVDGLIMPNIFLKVKAWQLIWLTRAIKSPEVVGFVWWMRLCLKQISLIQ